MSPSFSFFFFPLADSFLIFPPCVHAGVGGILAEAIVYFLSRSPFPLLNERLSFGLLLLGAARKRWTLLPPFSPLRVGPLLFPFSGAIEVKKIMCFRDCPIPPLFSLVPDRERERREKSGPFSSKDLPFFFPFGSSEKLQVRPFLLPPSNPFLLFFLPSTPREPRRREINRERGLFFPVTFTGTGESF